jgi:hypothetical protein
MYVDNVRNERRDLWLSVATFGAYRSFTWTAKNGAVPHWAVASEKSHRLFVVARM